MSAPLQPDAPGRTGVELLLPAALADAAGGRRLLTLRPVSASVPGTGPAGRTTVADVLVLLQAGYPRVYRKVCDEKGDLRRYVNLYLDGEDIRDLDGVATVLPHHAELLVLQSIAGG
ncbi:MoaD/ThiS family protein [Arthrobacter zhaoxinii]|uniref:MoaD/ThiS family protein n=1 Tax=Arthrobacter zhaoxinii TaxID=2964616 RepID=A0ABY5YS96_9MICC|nr:MoaD/ThiS family protein [Arthrobacter zhaoxinii]UWX97096.1 MoaD/ThiS family protein [Arthrobacter zhaoxinii]